MHAAAFWTVAPGKGELRSARMEAGGSGLATVETRFSCVSRGTERVVYEGRVPVSEYERMRCPFQEGDFPGPVKFGYMNVGVVTVGPAELIERSVFALFPHQDRFQIAPDDLVPVPDGIPPARAAIAAQMETALNASWDADPEEGSSIAVVGAGVVGLLVAWELARAPGAKVIVVDTDPRKQPYADDLGLEFATPDAAGDTWSGRAGLVVHASGNPAGLRLALELAAFEARVLELSWYGDAEVALPLGQAFHARRLTLQSSQVGAVSPRYRGKISHRERLRMALSRLEDPVFDALLTGSTRFADMPVAMADILGGKEPQLCHLIDYS